MSATPIEQLAEQLSRGELSLDNFLRQLAQPKTADLGDVQLDLDRRRRCGYPEAIFGEGKSLATLQRLIERMIAEKIDILATRITPDIAAVLTKQFSAARYNNLARTLRLPLPQSKILHPTSEILPRPLVAIVTAGTTDLPVAEEARETLLWMGVEPTLVQDVGVAGPHRLPEKLHLLDGEAVVIVVAGMEGAPQRRRRLCRLSRHRRSNQRRLRRVVAADWPHC